MKTLLNTMKLNLVVGRRICRLDYFIYSTVAWAFFLIIGILTKQLCPPLYVNEYAQAIWFTSYFFISLRIGQNRARDLNVNGFLYIALSVIPLVNVAFGLFMLLGYGTKGRNKFGPDPIGIALLKEGI